MPVLNCRFAFIVKFSSEVRSNVETLWGLRQGTSVWSPSEPRQQPHQPSLQSKPAGRPCYGQRPRATPSGVHALSESRQSRQSRLTRFWICDFDPNPKILILNPNPQVTRLKRLHRSPRARRAAIARLVPSIGQVVLRRKIARRSRSYLRSHPNQPETLSS